MYLSNNSNKGIIVTTTTIIIKNPHILESAQGMPNINITANKEKENAIRESAPIIAIGVLGVNPLLLRIKNIVKDIISARALIDKELKVDHNSIFRII